MLQLPLTNANALDVWRAEISKRIEREPGTHLVFVRYASGYTVHDEWVYNLADLKGSKVLFAHDLGHRNPELVAAYPDRTTWLVTVTGNASLPTRPSLPIRRRYSNRACSTGISRAWSSIR